MIEIFSVYSKYSWMYNNFIIDLSFIPSVIKWQETIKLSQSNEVWQGPKTFWTWLVFINAIAHEMKRSMEYAYQNATWAEYLIGSKHEIE